MTAQAAPTSSNAGEKAPCGRRGASARGTAGCVNTEHIRSLPFRVALQQYRVPWHDTFSHARKPAGPGRLPCPMPLQVVPLANLTRQYTVQCTTSRGKVQALRGDA